MKYEPETLFDLVTVIGSTRQESGHYEEFLKKTFTLIKPGGRLYYQTLDPLEDEAAFRELVKTNHLTIQAFLKDESYGFTARYWSISKERKPRYSNSL